MKKNVSKNNFDAKILQQMIEKYQEKIKELEKLEKTTRQPLSSRLARMRDSYTAQIQVANLCIEVLFRLGSVDVPFVREVFKKQENFKPIWVDRLLKDHREAVLKNKNK